MIEDQDKAKEDKAAAKPEAQPKAPKKGPTFYRNPEGGPLVTTKPKEKESADNE